MGRSFDCTCWLAPTKRVFDSACGFLAEERRIRTLLILSFFAGAAYCLGIFDVGFLTGRSPYWTNPRGLFPNSMADMPTALSGYLVFQRDRWQMPLFQVAGLGAPAGVNVIFTDSIPWVALAGRLAFRATGAGVNLYGAWTAMCFTASAVTLTALVAMLGQRNLAAAGMATIAGLTMPALLLRWGHMSLMAQFEIPLALMFYVGNRNSRKPWLVFGQAAGVSLLALWTHAYLFVMILGIVFATVAQATMNGALNWRAALAITMGVAGVSGFVGALSGYLASRGSVSAEGFGYYSLNALSPVLPQFSGLVPPLRDFIMDTTGGQYEGFSYLGGGVLLLVVLMILGRPKTLWTVIYQNPWLFGTIVGFTMLALSNIVYLGPWKIVDLPLTDRLGHATSIFRSSGRFIWPAIYIMTAVAISAVIPWRGRRGVVLLIFAAELQWIDTGLLRGALAERTRVQEPSLIDFAAWRGAIERHKFVRVLPEFACLAPPYGWNLEAAVEIELAAASAGRPINSVYASRFAVDCAGEQELAAVSPAQIGELTVYLSEFAGIDRVRKFAATSDSCRAGPRLVICSNIPGEAAKFSNLASSD